VKILWHSNVPWSQSGYGGQTAIWTRELRKLGHDVAISANWGLGGAGIEWEGMRVYPSDDAWGNRTLRAFARRHGEGDERQCQVISLMDVWTLDHRMLAGMRLASWCPVDHDPIPPMTTAYFELCRARPIAMSRFGEERMRRVGLDPLYVPHAVDTTVFRPHDDERADVREALGVPEGAFVVGMVAANKGSAVPRKSFPQVFQAFAGFHKRHPEAILYLHCEKLGHYDGINMEALAIACYAAASGAYVIMGINSPVEGSTVVTDILSEGWERTVGGKIEFVVEPEEMVRRILEHIDKKRAALGLPAWEADRFGRSGDARMLEIEALEPEARAEAIYGVPAI